MSTKRSAGAPGGGRRRCRPTCRWRRPRPERRRSWRASAAHPRLGLHGRRHQDARHRLPAVEPRLELPRPARVADQLRRQQEARVPHLHARGIGVGDGARLLQDRRQADDDALPRHRRPAARRDGGLQRLVRPRAGDHRRRQRPRRRQAAAGRADVPLGAGHQRAGARLHQVGRHAGRRCSTSRSRSCAPTRSR